VEWARIGQSPKTINKSSKAVVPGGTLNRLEELGREGIGQTIKGVVKKVMEGRE